MLVPSSDGSPRVNIAITISPNSLVTASCPAPYSRKSWRAFMMPETGEAKTSTRVSSLFASCSFGMKFLGTLVKAALTSSALMSTSSVSSSIVKYASLPSNGSSLYSFAMSPAISFVFSAAANSWSV